MNEPLNKFTLEVEEMYCTECVNVNGHLHTGKYWTCIICGYQNGIKKGLLKRVIDGIILSSFKRKMHE